MVLERDMIQMGLLILLWSRELSFCESGSRWVPAYCRNLQKALLAFVLPVSVCEVLAGHNLRKETFVGCIGVGEKMGEIKLSHCTSSGPLKYLNIFFIL